MRYCFLLIILLFLIGCQPDELPADRYVQWVNTKLKSQASNEEFDFSLHYQPSAYQALRELEEVN